MSTSSLHYGLDLPEYPWEKLAPYRKIAEKHSDGVVNLSIGSPVDPTPEFIQKSLAEAADAHTYPLTSGTPELREAIVEWFARRRGVSHLTAENVIPTVGSKEMVTWLPFFLGLGKDDIVVRPKIAYPTYGVGAQFVGATAIASDNFVEDLNDDELDRVRLIWLNSPGNPTGNVLDKSQLKNIVNEARKRNIVLASDECYAELGWGQWDIQTSLDSPDPAKMISKVPSVLDPEVCGGDSSLLFALYSLSKQSNMAGYRASFMAGDEKLLENILNSRKHAGMIVPAPIQTAMVTALGNEQHVQVQKNKYRYRRELIKNALEQSGYQVDDSAGGLYLWTTDSTLGKDQDCWALVERFAQMGMIVGPGIFYGDQGARHIRIAITTTDEGAEKAAARILNRKID